MKVIFLEDFEAQLRIIRVEEYGARRSSSRLEDFLPRILADNKFKSVWILIYRVEGKNKILFIL